MAARRLAHSAFQKIAIASSKSTKEIAREAVESEYKQKKKRDSSDDEEVKPKKQRHNKLTSNDELTAEKLAKDEELARKYRDRAKERREGNAPYEQSVSIDEEDELEQARALGLDKKQLLRERNETTKSNNVKKFPKNKIQAEKLLATLQAKSQLGKELHAFFCKQPAPVATTSAGRVVQRSSLTFILQPINPRVVYMPHEQTVGGNMEIAKASPLPDDILRRLQQSIQRRIQISIVIKDNKQIKTAGTTSSDEDDNDIFENVDNDYDPMAPREMQVGETVVKPFDEPSNNRTATTQQQPQQQLPSVLAAQSQRLVGFAKVDEDNDDMDADFDGRSEWETAEEKKQRKQQEKKKKK
jgi:hypothetical protein